MATLSSLLVQRSVASMSAVEDAIARQVLSGGDLATNLLEVRAAREDDITRLAAESLGLAPLVPGKIAAVDPAVLRLLPGDVAHRHGIFPIEKRGNDLVVATSEPLSQHIEEDLGFLLNLNLRPVYALRVRIVQALGEHYGQAIDRRHARLLAKLEGRKLEPGTEPPPPPPNVAPPQPSVTNVQPARPVVYPPQRPTLRGLSVVPEDAITVTTVVEPQPDLAFDPVAALPTTIELSPRPALVAPAPEPQPAPPPEPVAPAESTTPALAEWGRPSADDARSAKDLAQPDEPERSQGRSRRKGPFPAALAGEEMQSAITTESVLEIFFDFAQQLFEYAALFVVHGDIAEGRDAAGRGADRERVAAVGLPLDLPSTLALARDRRVPVFADLAGDGLDAELLRDLGRAPASVGFAASPTAPAARAAATVIPIVVRGRAVALLFGDDAPAAVDPSMISEVIALAALAGASIERIILRRKQVRSGSAPRVAPSAVAPAAKAPVAPAEKAPAPPLERASDRPPPARAAAPEAVDLADDTRPARPDPRTGMAALARMFAGGRAPSAAVAPPPAAPVPRRETLAAAIVDSLDASNEPPPAAPVLVRDYAFEDVPNLFSEATPAPLLPDEIPAPLSPSSGGALTVALLQHADTPPVADSWEPSDDAAHDGAEPAGHFEALPDDELETVVPGGVKSHGDVESDSNVETVARPVAPTLHARPPSPDHGRPEAPMVGEIVDDSTDDLASAIARAAEAAGDLDAHHVYRDPRDAPPDAPPVETLTDGFPGVSEGTAASPDVPLTTAFVTPPAAGAAGAPLEATSLETLLALAASGAEVAAARAELKQRAERNLAPLLALFPGPLDQDRHRSADRLPPASQCGPLLQALAQTGARGAATVAVLARYDDVDRRFWAAHLLGELPSLEAASGLLAFLVDTDASVRRIALRSAAALLAASLPGRPLETALGSLASAPGAPLRERTAAIETMGQLRVASVVPTLVDLVTTLPDEVAEAARRALLVVTRQDFGRDPQRWTEWWTKHQRRHRIEWLIDALMHETQSIRRAAGDELKQLTKEYFGYYDDLPKRERERAQERYRDWWEREGRSRFR